MSGNLKSNIKESIEQSSEVNEEATKVFQLFLWGFIIVLLIFMGMFIYNLIKCYLPKWMNKQKTPVREEPTNQPYDLQISKIDE